MTGTSTVTRGLRWSVGVLGVSLMVVAVGGIWVDRGYTAPAGLLRWLVACIVLSDFVIAPAVLVVGFLVARLVPAVVRPAVATGLTVAGAVLLVGVPVLLGARRPRANPTVLPLDYGRGLLETLVVVVVLTALGACALLVRARRGTVTRRSETG